jgi:uncharacterized coiled-coil protein SlyX
MPTQEERLSTLEETVIVLGKSIDDLNHNVTILPGVTSEQGKDIRGIKVNLAALSERVDAFEQRVDRRFEMLDGRIGTFEQSVNRRFETLDSRIGALDGRVSGLDSRIETLEQTVNSRFEEQGKKLDQVLLLLNSVIPRSEQGA